MRTRMSLNCCVRQWATPPMPPCSVFSVWDQSVVPNGMACIFIDGLPHAPDSCRQADHRCDLPMTLYLNRVLQNKHQAVSQGVRRLGKRSPPEADEHLQKPHNAGSRREARFFDTLLNQMTCKSLCRIR